MRCLPTLLLLGLFLAAIAPVRADPPRREVAVRVTAVTADNLSDLDIASLESLPSARSLADVLLITPGGVQGTTDATGTINLRGLAFRPGQTVYASFGADAVGGHVLTLDTRPDPSLLLPADVLERVEVLRGPQGTLWGCPRVDGIVNLTTKEFVVQGADCTKPAVYDLGCPSRITLNTGVTFNPIVNIQAAEPIDYAWTMGGAALDSGLPLSYRFDRLGAYTLTLNARNDYGTDAASCTIEVDEDARRPPYAGIHIGYSIEFQAAAVGVRASVPLPTRQPISLDGKLDYYLQDVGSSFNLNLEAAYSVPVGDKLSASLGIGPHLYFGSGNTEIGAGATGTLYYDLGGPILPALDVSVSRIYGTFAPYVGLTAAFSRP